MTSANRIVGPAESGWKGRSSNDVRLVATAFLERTRPATGHDTTQLANRVSAAGGHVVQIVESLVVAWFDSATDCIAFFSENTSPDLRAGLSAGDVLIEKGLVHGIPMIEAARLKELARPGHILFTRKLHGLTGLSRDVALGMGALELKGIAEPVEVFELK